MSNILLAKIDSKLPNLALHKIETYHFKRGDVVLWCECRDLFLERWADKIYVSCVFTENKRAAMEWEGLAWIGGSGYDLSVVLPPEIETVKPHINLGFTTRGCIRKCGFCIVPEKEGNIRVVGDLRDLWDGLAGKIVVLDNNILAVPEHFEHICGQARSMNVIVDFNQGLDHRLLTDELAYAMSRIRHGEFRFAFDSPADTLSVERALGILRKNRLSRSFWYVLVGYNTTYEEDMYRLSLLRGWRQTVFVQRYSKNRGNLLLSQWANRHAMFKSVTFRQFLALPRYAAYRMKYADEVDAYLTGGGE